MQAVNWNAMPPILPVPSRSAEGSAMSSGPCMKWCWRPSTRPLRKFVPGITGTIPTRPH
ncbi:hypothetical protein AU15_02705 [Marinobacter salarius]|uniref:Uncharacterized protein n=1 Tax=Marinobacter salarius TaxID=1420917 RepID=W5YP36_9GAMM|nr:hypothetical protein AU15_02705 [Marinobacter salarius]